MKIGLVLPAVPAYSETFFVNKIKGLQAQGHEVVLFVYANTTQSSFEGAKVIIAPKWTGKSITGLLKVCSGLLLALFHIKAVSRFYRLERKDGISVFAIAKRIVANSHLLSAKLDWLHFGFGTMALERENIAQSVHAKMAVSFRGFDIAIYPLKYKNCYQKLWEKTDKIHVISDDIAALVYKNGFQKAEKVFKICPAIDVDYFSATSPTAGNPKIQIMIIARLHWKKGLEYTLEALALVKQKGISFQYTIVGDGPEKERLLFAAHQLGLKDNIIFAGKLPPEEVRKHLETCSLYLQYSIQEGFCNAVLEAQAMGKLCIVSDAEGLAENVLDGITGFVVAKRNPVSLAGKILEAVSLKAEEQKKMTDNAVGRIKKEFSIQEQIKQFVKFYEDY